MIRFLPGLLLALLPAGLAAATFTVDSTFDSGEPGSLRWAVEAHLAAGGSSEIRFDASLSGQVIGLAADLPSIDTGALIIDGGDAPGVAVEGSPNGRIFVIHGSPYFEMRDITLRDAAGPAGDGCLRHEAGDAEIVVARSRFIGCETARSGNLVAGGGAIGATFNAAGPGRLTVTGSYFGSNRALAADGAAVGGAIHTGGGASVRLEGNIFESNSVEGGASAILRGGAVHVDNAIAIIENNEFRSNHAFGGDGGALAMALQVAYGAGVYGNLFVDNASRDGAAAWVDNLTLPLGRPNYEFTQNTFVSNTSDGVTGGALFLNGGELTIRSNTFVDNLSLSGGAANLAYRSLVEFVAIWNNLFGPAESPSCVLVDGVPAPHPSAGHNIRPDDSCGFDGVNDVVGDPGAFLSLADYGGPTRTLPPATGNLALDTANPVTPGSGDPSLCPPFDARGMPRPGDGDGDGIAVCDIGAVEWILEAPIFLDGFESPAPFLP